MMPGLLDFAAIRGLTLSNVCSHYRRASLGFIRGLPCIIKPLGSHLGPAALAQFGALFLLQPRRWTFVGRVRRVGRRRVRDVKADVISAKRYRQAGAAQARLPTMREPLLKVRHA